MLARKDASPADLDSPADLLHRVVSFIPQLRDAQADADAQGQYSAELRAAFSEAGIYAMLRPSRFGGLELGLPDYLKAIVALSSGCPSIGLSVGAATSQVLSVAALFPEEVQSEVFAAGEDVLVCTSAEALEATPVKAGWQLRGRWPLCDGAPHATWFLAPVLLPAKSNLNERERGVAIVHRSKFEIIEDWRDVLGLRGAGSHSIRLDTIVPDNYVVRIACPSIENPTSPPGWALHGGPLYDGRSGSLSLRVLCAVAVGIGHASLAWYEHALRTRTTPFPPKIPRSQEPNSQRYYGLALGMVNSAQSIMLEAAAQHIASSEESLLSGAPVSSEDELHLVTLYQQAVNLCWEAVELMFATGGSSASRGDSAMTRYFRDMSTLRTRNELHYEGYARALSLHHFKDAEPLKS